MIAELAGRGWEWVLLAWALWQAGGWGMAALAALGVALFGKGTRVHLALRDWGRRRVPEKTWRGWVMNPGTGHGELGDWIRRGMAERTLSGVVKRLGEMRGLVVGRLAWDLKVMLVLVLAAPVAGVAGGIWEAFRGMADGGGTGDAGRLVAGEIADGLIPVQTGLLLALAGFFWRHGLSAGLRGLDAFLARIETACAQQVHRAAQAGTVAGGNGEN